MSRVGLNQGVVDALFFEPGKEEVTPFRLNTYIGDTEGKIAILLEARDGLT